jgi:hypothetical protein
MIEGYLSIKETAKKWGLKERSVRLMCADGRIPGAAKLGREWAVPADAERPIDGRITTGEYKDYRKNQKNHKEK